MTAIERAKANRKTFYEISEFMLPYMRELAVVPPNYEKAALQGYAVLKDGAVFVAREDGELIGVFGIVESDVWYSDETVLRGKFLYVKPDRAFGDVGVKLLRAGRDYADERKKLLFIDVDNPDRQKKQTKAGYFAQLAGYIPNGYTVKLSGGNRG